MPLRNRLGTLRAFLILGLGYSVSQTVILIILRPLGLETFLHLQVSFSKDFYLQTFNAWKSQGVFLFYSLHLYPDLLHPIWYSLFLISAMACLLKYEPAGERLQGILILPVISGLADYVENALQFVILSGKLTDTLVFTSSMASVIKWTLAAFSLVGIAILGVRRAGILR